jgi:oligosaccharide repeat unit polymerase
MLREGIADFPAEIILQVFLMIIFFLIVFYVGYIIPWPGFFIKIFKKLDYSSSFNPRKLSNYAKISFCFGFLPLIIWGGGLKNIIYTLTHGGRWAAAWGRAAYGEWEDYIKALLGYFNLLGIQLVVVYVFLIRKKLILILLAMLGLWVIFNSGTRSALGAAILPAFILYYLSSFHKKKKVRYQVFLWILLLLGIMQLQLIIRDAPEDVNIKEIISDNLKGVIEKSPIEYHRDDQFYQLLKFVQYVPGVIPYSGEFLILRPLYHFIPRAIWKNKPEGITKFFERETAEPGITGSFAGSIIGDFYLVQGWWGICIIGIFLGFLAKQFDSLIEMSLRSPAVLLMYSYGLAFLFVSIRSFQIIYESWYVFIFMYLMLKRLGYKEKSVQYNG